MNTGTSRMSNILLGGNQRELARAKNLKKQQAAGKTKKGEEKDGNKGANLVKRQERCTVNLVYLNEVKFLMKGSNF